MTINFDNETIEIPCSGCGKKFQETIRRIKGDPRLTCSACGTVNAVDADQFRKVEQAIKKSMDDLGKALGKLDK
ncbi:hypothetical protein PEP31012_03585 [Pandoraea eparura]|uniref:Uncharacterized protein n=1 Tax=Pandoraea eparura TaxID=2508291 RepID=A0A5E4WYW8_9BURK|nr:zinc ribbon domain-containing protein [Pandoraea eparura]VVE29340.1 hypothetical protein PEP31012_03585 [Pandoraea eparura]